MESEKLLRFFGLALSVVGMLICLAALILDLKVLWAIGPGSLGAGVALWVLFGQQSD